jgi:DNA-binding LacI/PurR family transcriptional regulator
MVTIRELAKKCGCSASTVSMVLNNRPLARYIPAGTKATIRRIAGEMNYQPNIFAQSLRANRSYTVGVMVFDITDPYCTYTLRGIENMLNAASIAYLLFDAQNKRERFDRNLELMLQRRVDGVILVANSLQTDPAVLETVQIPRIPVVVIGRELEGLEFASTIVVNNQRGGFMALEHLYNLGHRDIAFIRGPKTIADSVLRWEGIVKFAREADLKMSREWILELVQVPTTSAEGLEGIKSLLTSGRRRFTAVLAFDDMTALGVIRGLSEAGLEVPRDCSVIGFDDIDAAGYYNPPLTTIRQPMLRMGEEAASALLDCVNAGQKKKKVQVVHRVLEPETIVRKSTGPPHKTKRRNN